jgi:acyl-CoA thioester hydrolase
VHPTIDRVATGLPVDTTAAAVPRGYGDRGEGTMYTPVETYRGFVYPWVIDHVGHMNVQFYTARFDEASWHFLAQLGLTPAFLKRNARAAVAVDQRTQYKREVLAGTLIHITSELVSLGRTSIRFVHRMFDSETREEVAVSELVGVYFDTDCRAATPLPAQVHGRAGEMLTTSAEVLVDSGDDTAEMVAIA